MSLAPYVRILGRGPGRSRSLTREEARDAMRLILDDEVKPEAVGALLMLMRFRGESAPEIAGFVEAMRASLILWREAGAALDWPSYAAGRTRGRPYFLLAAKLIAEAGYPVLLHGWNSHQNPVADVRSALATLSIPVVETPDAARACLASGGIAYAPLEALDSRLLGLLRLRDTLGLRSAVNTALRLLNPAGTAVSVQGVFHPPYRDLQCDAGSLLDQPSLTVIKGGGGEFERNPAKAVAVHRMNECVRKDFDAPAILTETRRMSEDAASMPVPQALWSGRATDPYAESIVRGTAALALLALDAAKTLTECESLATDLWHTRRPSIAA